MHSKKRRDFDSEMRTNLNKNTYVRDAFARIAMERSTDKKKTARELGGFGFNKNEIRKAVKQAEYHTKI